jgi:2-methylcitrate dehydratase PrpD
MRPDAPTLGPITGPLADFVATLRHDALPEVVQRRVRLLLLDLIGNMVGGHAAAESTAPLLAAARAMGQAGGNATVFAEASGWTPTGAALLNGALAHSLDFDDTHAASSLHPGAPVIPAALAAAEMVGARGADALAAIVAGYEVTNRLGLALPAGAHYARGFHPTATCGAFGAAAAAARVLGLDAAGVANALGIGLSQAAGSLQFLANGAWTKRFQVGWAAMAGLSAALLAREGFRGAAEPLEGKAGFLAAYAPAPDPGRVLLELGTAWETMKTAVKPYPSCRYGHAGIDAALALRAEHGLSAGEIDAVTLGLPQAGMILIGSDIDRRRTPRNIVDGQFSGPFVVACALARGAFGWDSYAEIAAPDLSRLMALTDCVFDPEIEAEYPANMSGRLTVVARGQSFTRKVVVPKGEPDNFLSEAELMAKYRGLADPVLGPGRAAALAEAALGLDRAADVRGLLALGAGRALS